MKKFIPNMTNRLRMFNVENTNNLQKVSYIQIN